MRASRRRAGRAIRRAHRRPDQPRPLSSPAFDPLRELELLVPELAREFRNLLAAARFAAAAMARLGATAPGPSRPLLDHGRAPRRRRR